jgi:manganese/zinc/iron transport system substrate-binding protein
MIAEAVRAVGGTYVQVDQLMPAGVDPHLYRPTARDKWRINAADVVFYNGLRLEGRLEPLLVKRSRVVPVFAVTEKLLRESRERLRPLAEEAGIYDPHVWLDPELWAECVLWVAECLSRIDPAHAQQYQSGARAYVSALAKLDRYAQEQLAGLPEARRVLVTTHDAFGYFGRRYGLQVESLQGLSTLDEIDLRTMNRLIQHLVREKVPAVFVESTVSPKALQAVVAGCRAAGHELRIGGELYADCLGPAGSPGETFLGAFRWNVDTIVKALR